MLDNSAFNIKGYVCVRDWHTKEVLEQKTNAIHYGNITTAIAKAFSGNSDSFISYMAFGNGGITIDDSGTITYRPTRTSEVKNLSESLYSTTYVSAMTNATDITPGINNVTVLGGNTSNYEDIICTVVLQPNEPGSQLNYDNATGVNDLGDVTSTYVFNEIALYSGEKGIALDFSNPTVAVQSVDNFLNNDTTVLLTHVIFHPVQKSKNRTLEITYTIRIQMDLGV